MKTILKKFNLVVVSVLFIFTIAFGIKPVHAQTQADQSWNDDGALKILSIGNSFSIDATQYLYSILNGMGVKNIKVGDLHIGGISLDEHYRCAKNNYANYNYRVTTGNGWKSKTNYSLKKAVSSDDWDYIILQQSGTYSGFPVTYDKLDGLIKIIKKYNSDAMIVWHMNWAFQNDARYAGFEKYGYDQGYMYNAIVSTLKEVVKDNPNIDYIIPAGTAIQNARTSFMGDTLTRDGKHLSLDIGRYIAGLTFAATLSGLPASETVFCPSDVSLEEKRVAVESVKNAIKSPYKVKRSQYQDFQSTTCTISFQANGGEGAPSPQIKKAGKGIVLTMEEPTRKGYTFLGWGVHKKSSLPAYMPGEVYTKNADVTLYAVWKAAAYSIKYDKNGGTGTMYTTKTKYGETAVLRNNRFKREGYKFAGWNTKADGTGISYSNKASVKNLTAKDGSSVKLYAQWKIVKYKIDYYLNHGKNSSENPAYYTIESGTITLQKPVRKGFTFKGWYTSSDYTWNIKDISYEIKENLHLYAKWRRNTYAIQYEANGGKGKMETIGAYYGKEIVLSKNHYTRKGYVFAGWNTKADGTGKAFTDQQIVKSLTAKNNAVVKLYAQWEKI